MYHHSVSIFYVDFLFDVIHFSYILMPSDHDHHHLPPSNIQAISTISGGMM